MANRGAVNSPAGSGALMEQPVLVAHSRTWNVGGGGVIVHVWT
jgi:hypothetical protein